MTEDLNRNAIETEYDGHLFRSVLEARWAVFFKAAGIEYEYENYGYEGHNGKYCPDFYLPQFDIFAEVKGCDEWLKQDWDKIIGCIDWEATPVSKGLLILGQIPFKDEHHLPFFNFIRYTHEGWGSGFGLFVLGETVFYKEGQPIFAPMHCCSADKDLPNEMVFQLYTGSRSIRDEIQSYQPISIEDEIKAYPIPLPEPERPDIDRFCRVFNWETFCAADYPTNVTTKERYITREDDELLCHHLYLSTNRFYYSITHCYKQAKMAHYDMKQHKFVVPELANED